MENNIEPQNYLFMLFEKLPRLYSTDHKAGEAQVYDDADGLSETQPYNTSRSQLRILTVSDVTLVIGPFLP